MSWQSIVLYGAETSLSGEYPAVGDITLKSSGSPDYLVSYTYDLNLAGSGFSVENYENEYVNEFTSIVNSVRIKYSMRSVPLHFPSTETKIEDYYPFDFIKARYKWIHFVNFPLVPETIADAVVATAMAVNLVKASAEPIVGGNVILMEFEARNIS